MLFVKQFLSIFITLSLIVQTSLANSSTFTTSNVNINNAYNIAKNLDSSYLNKNGTINIIDKGLNDSSNYTNIVAIDSSSLGGMYANKINLIATNDGVGVNNKGIILATNIKINANGDIINSGKIKSNATTKIKADRFINKDNLQKTEINSYYAVLKANEIINYGIFNFKFLEVYSDKFINNSSNLNLANAVIYSNDFILKNAKLNVIDNMVLISPNIRLKNANLNIKSAHIYTEAIDKSIGFSENIILHQMQNNIELKPNNEIIHKLNLLFKQNSIANKERILSSIANDYAVLFGLKQDNINVKLLNEQIIGANSELFMGNFNKDAPNTIFINLANIDNPIKIISVIAHELTHLIDNSKNIFIPNDITQNKRAIHNGYLASYHAIKAQINKDNQLIYLYEPLINTYNDNELLIKNLNYFNGLDVKNSDNNPVMVAVSKRVAFQA